MEGDFRPGAVLLEKYRVDKVLGRGGMGIVLRATLCGVIGIVSVVALAGACGSTGSADPPSPVAAARDAAPGADGATTQRAVAPGGADLRHKAAQCQELEAHNDWQKLRDCAAELADLGAHDMAVQARAEEFWRKAVKEAPNALVADKVQAALREGNLREAQKQLTILKPDSVYWASTSSAFRSAEAEALRDIWRKAQVLAAIHDCVALERLRAQLSASSTPGIAAAVAAVKCSNKAQPPCDTRTSDDLMSQAQNQFYAGFAKAALVLMAKALGCKQDARMFRTAATYACAARDATSAQVYFDRVPAQFQAAIVQRCQQQNIDLQTADTSPSKLSPCDEPIDIDDLVTQAQNQYAAGFAKTALQLLTKALRCRQDVRMVRMAATYACAAHDAPDAKLFYAKVPAQYQEAIRQRCDQEGIKLGP